MTFTDEQRKSYGIAIRDIQNSSHTLWVERLKKERPDLYQYAIKKREMEK